MSKKSSFRRSFFGSKKRGISSKDVDDMDLDLDIDIDIDELAASAEINKFLLSCENGDISTLRSILVQYDDVHGDEHEVKENQNRLQLLLNHQDPNTNKTGLIYAAIAGHVHIVEELIKQGTDIEKSYDGSTPLYHATSRGHVEVVKILLNYSANVNAVNNKGWSCLMNAAYFGRDDIVNLLLKYKANPDIVRAEFDGKSALHFGRMYCIYYVYIYKIV